MFLFMNTMQWLTNSISEPKHVVEGELGETTGSRPVIFVVDNNPDMRGIHNSHIK